MYPFRIVKIIPTIRPISQRTGAHHVLDAHGQRGQIMPFRVEHQVASDSHRLRQHRDGMPRLVVTTRAGNLRSFERHSPCGELTECCCNSQQRRAMN